MGAAARPAPARHSRRPLGAVDILHLQQTGGNRAVGKILQRDTGLRKEDVTNAFARKAYDYWAKNKTKTREEFATDMLRELNKGFLAYPVDIGIETSGAPAGLFHTSARSFGIEINPNAFSERSGSTIGALSQNEVAKVVGTLYHEARHAEQSFRVARLEAGRMKPGEDKAEQARRLAKQLVIPEAVAVRAIELALDPAKADPEAIKEAELWANPKDEPKPFRDAVYRLVNVEAAELRKVSRETKGATIPDLGTAIEGAERQIGIMDAEKANIKDATRLGAIRSLVVYIGFLETAYADHKKNPTTETAEGVRLRAQTVWNLVLGLYNQLTMEKDAEEAGGAAAKKLRGMKPAAAP